MNGLKAIVAPLDGSRFSERALPYAIELAKSSGARLILLRAAGQPLSLEAVVDPIDAKFDALDDAEAELADTIERIKKAEIAVEPHVYSGEPARAIIDSARLNGAGLIVMATHGRAGLGRWLYGSVADKVIRGSRLPVLLVPITCEQGWAADQTRRIVVTLDGSVLAEEVLDGVAPVAAALGAELLLVRVVAPGKSDEAGVTTAQAYLEGVAQRLRHDGHSVRPLALEGAPAQKVASLAREMDARIIAMATHGRAGVARYVLGSVAAEVLHRSTTPLLVMRPARVGWRTASPEDEPTAIGDTPVSLRVTAREAQLLSEAVGLLLSVAEKEEHLARPLHDLQEKLANVSVKAPTAAPVV